MVAIPRIEETNAEPLSLIFDAKTDEWRNIAELFISDQVKISILPDHKKLPNLPNNIASVKNIFKLVKQDGEFKIFIQTADCSEGQKPYSPLCGRYSIYSGQYVNGCNCPENCNNPNDCVNINTHMVCWSKINHTELKPIDCMIDPLSLEKSM